MFRPPAVSAISGAPSTTSWRNSPITADGATTDFVATDTGAFDGQSSGMKFAFSGTGLVYSGSFPNIHRTAGTITAIEVRDASDQVLATFTGFKIPATRSSPRWRPMLQATDRAGRGWPSGCIRARRDHSRPSTYNVTGNCGPDYFEGGNLADTINGSGGNDYLDGAGGADTMTGGFGKDVYIVEHAGDVVNENRWRRHERRGRRVYRLCIAGQHRNPEPARRRSDQRHGDDLNNLIYGNLAANVIHGLGGNDYLDGGTGADTMIGGFGQRQLHRREQRRRHHRKTPTKVSNRSLERHCQAVGECRTLNLQGNGRDQLHRQQHRQSDLIGNSDANYLYRAVAETTSSAAKVVPIR